MTPISEAQSRLIALQKHWVNAESVNRHLRRSMKQPEEGPSGMSEEWAQLAAAISAASVMFVWYSLLFVVVEGYIELGCQDAQVDTLLANEEYVSLLRRFRNATFHYQGDILSPKLEEFLAAKDSSQWVHNLNRALKSFFERELINNPEVRHAMENLMQHPPEL